MLHSGLPGDGGDGGRRPGHRLLALGFPNSSGLCTPGSGSRHRGPHRRGSRRLVFLIFAAHVSAAGEQSSRSRSPAAAQQKPESSSRLPAPTPPPSLLHPGSAAGAPAQLVGLIRLRLSAPGSEPHGCCRAPLVAKFLVIELRGLAVVGREKGARPRLEGEKSRVAQDLLPFDSCGPPSSPPFGVTVGGRSRGLLGRREIRSQRSERWRTLSGMSFSAFSRMIRPLQQEPRKTKRKRNGRGHQGLQTKPGKEDLRALFLFLLVFGASEGNSTPARSTESV